MVDLSAMTRNEINMGAAQDFDGMAPVSLTHAFGMESNLNGIAEQLTVKTEFGM